MSKNVKVSSVIHESHQQLHVSMQPLAIHLLWADHERFVNYPEYQRGKVWPLRYQQELIDSVLRGYPIPAIIASRKIDKDMGTRNYIVDGQQRTSTIMKYRKGDFATASVAMRSRYESSAMPPVEPHKTYQQLSLAARNNFDNYQLTLQIYDDIDDLTAGEIFRKLQHQIPLTRGEMLNTYVSNATQIAHRLEKHPFWDQMYAGRKYRSEVFQAALLLLLMERSKTIGSLSSKNITNLAAGIYDAEVINLYDQVEERLFLCQHVFAGSIVEHRTDLIPMYQATIFLENEGLTFISSNEGLLTPWFTEVIKRSRWGGPSGFASPIHILNELRPQREFWDIHLPQLVKLHKGVKVA